MQQPSPPSVGFRGADLLLGPTRPLSAPVSVGCGDSGTVVDGRKQSSATAAAAASSCFFSNWKVLSKGEEVSLKVNRAWSENWEKALSREQIDDTDGDVPEEDWLKELNPEQVFNPSGVGGRRK